MEEALVKAARCVRTEVLRGLHRAGGFRLIAGSGWRRRRLLVLCYHGVSLEDEHEWDPELFVAPAFLRRRFEILRDNGYTVLPLGDATERCRAGTLPPRSVVLTFDDGLSDFAQIVAPMLKEFGFAATVYVTTYYAEKQWPVVPGILSYLLWRAGERLAFLDWPEVGLRAKPGEDLPSLRRRMLKHLKLFAVEKALSGYDQWVLTQSLAEKLHVDLDIIRRRRVLHIMTREEIRAVASAGVDIQLHTHRHRVPRDQTLFEAEIAENQQRLEAWTGHRPEHFCYPNGLVFAECLPWLNRLHVRTATTCRPGLYSAETNPLLMPRFVDTLLQSELAFESWLSGAGSVLRFGPGLWSNGNQGLRAG